MVLLTAVWVGPDISGLLETLQGFVWIPEGCLRGPGWTKLSSLSYLRALAKFGLWFVRGRSGCRPGEDSWKPPQGGAGPSGDVEMRHRLEK